MNELSPFWSKIQGQKGQTRPRIGFADSSDPRVLQAAEKLAKDAHIKPLLIGSYDKIKPVLQELHLSILDEKSVLPIPPENEKQEKSDDPLFQGMTHLVNNQLDGLIAGSLRPTADVVKAALRCIGPRAGTRFISGQFLIESENRTTAQKTPFLFADCAVVPEPSPRILAAIAKEAAHSYRFFTGQEPRIALLSFATRGSADHALVDRLREALQIIKKQTPELVVDGELQVDAALDGEVAKIKKAGDSPVANQANVFIFPNLESANIGYKLVQRFSNARVAGPLLWGLKKPVSDLSRGCNVQEIIDTAYCVSHMITGLN